VVNFHISGYKMSLPGTRDTVGQFRDDPGYSGMDGKPTVHLAYIFTMQVLRRLGG